MAWIKIGTTCSGKDLLVEGAGGGQTSEMQAMLAAFSAHDLFDFAMALECLQIAETRKDLSPLWSGVLETLLFEVVERAGPHVIQRVREELGIVSAFAARDHGKKCLAPHFRG